MKLVEGNDLYMTRGDTESIVVMMTQDDDPRPFTDGDAVTFTMRSKKRDASEIAYQVEVTEFDDDGRAVIPIPHEATVGLDAGRYAYDVQVVGSDGSYVTIIGGEEKPAFITLWQDVTW